MWIVYVVVGLLVLLGIRGIISDRNNTEKLKDKLAASYGKRRNKDYSMQGKNHRSKLFERFGTDDTIDSITWNDLEMDKVFERIDSCLSAAGEEALYYRLHKMRGEAASSICSDIKNNISADKIDFDRLVEALNDNETARNELLYSLSKIGYLKKLSPYDYLDYLTGQKSKAPIKDLLLDFLFLPLIALIVFKPIWGIAGIFVLIVVNTFIYFRDKKELDGLLVTLAFLVRVSKEACRLGEKSYNFLEKKVNERVKSSHKLFKQIISSGNYLIASGRNNAGGTASSSPIEVILTYINMFFHIDLIQYRLMLGKLAGKSTELEWIIGLFGDIDCAISVGSYRKNMGSDNWCKPIFTDGKARYLTLDEAWHPLIDKPVKNSIKTESGILLTGSNASGKSTFLRTVAINSILAQTINTVCASKYEAPVYKIYSSIALTDNLSGGESYFIVEIKSLKRILDAAEDGSPVLCFVDEVLRGTNTVERICASKVVLESLCGKNVLCFAATHDGELTQLLDGSVKNYHFMETIEGADVKFDYKLKEGPAKTRNALALLKNYGYPDELISKAEKMARDFESNT